MDQLWILTAWKRPWRGAQPIYLSSRGVDMETLAKIAPLGGLPLLCRLPGELLEMIRGYSENSFFWRCRSALRLASVIRPDPEPLVTIPLSEIVSWESGLKLQTVTVRPPVIRITIGSDGINKVESLSYTPQYSGACYTDSAFIVSGRSAVSGVMAYMKVCAKCHPR